MSTGLSSKLAFCYGLLGITLSPMVFFIFVGARADIAGVAATKWLLMLLGAAHVPATLAFYADPGFRQIAAHNPLALLARPNRADRRLGLVFAASSARRRIVLLRFLALADLGIMVARTSA